MSERLQNALSRFDKYGARTRISDLRVLADAARRVLEGEQVQWCETHESVVPPDLSTHCRVVAFAGWSLEPCSIVPKLLVNVDDA